MDGFFIEYRDPLFGIILFFTIVFIISLSSILWRMYSTRKNEKNLRKFVKRFELFGFDDEIVWLLKNSNEPITPLKLLANIYSKSGDIEKAIRIYLAILESLPISAQRLEVMELLGGTYFKAGFLQRSKDIFLEILKNYPRHKSALTYLMYVYESLGEYKKALELLESLEELDVDTKREYGFFSAKSIIAHSSMSVDKKCLELEKILKKYTFIQREVMSFFATNSKTLFWKQINSQNTERFIDLLWSVQKRDVDLQKVEQIPFLKELYSAKGYFNLAQKSSKFEFEVLIALNRCSNTQGSLSFEYICDECKYVYPLYVSRCQNCQSLLEVEPFAVLEKKESSFEENNSLL
ncbi:MAG: tetratricopeptide repeat protein [Campylobacterales bacterium]